MANPRGAEQAIAPGLITRSDAARIYSALYRARRFDEVAVALQRQGAIGGYGQAIGQEAAQVGAMLALAPKDMVFPSYRQPGAALMRGVTVTDLLTFHARLDYCPWDWKERRFAPYAVPVGSQLAHAVGWAIADSRASRGAVTIVFFGDGASSQGEVHEAMNMAGVTRAPVVFLCENNGWAISTPVARQTAAPALYVRAHSYGMTGIQVDGNDVLRVRHQVQEAVRMAREGFGPVLIEALTYRMAGHTTSDDPTIYRTADEVTTWAQRDPIEQFKRWGLANNLFDEHTTEMTRKRIDREMDVAVKSWIDRKV